MLNFDDFSTNLGKVLLECSLFMSFGTTPYTFDKVNGAEVEEKYDFQKGVITYLTIYLWEEYGVAELEDFLRNSHEVISMEEHITEQFIRDSVDRYLDDDLMYAWKIKQGTIAFGYLVAKLRTAQDLTVYTANPQELGFLENIFPRHSNMKLFAVAMLI